MMQFRSGMVFSGESAMVVVSRRWRRRRLDAGTRYTQAGGTIQDTPRSGFVGDASVPVTKHWLSRRRMDCSKSGGNTYWKNV